MEFSQEIAIVQSALHLGLGILANTKPKEQRDEENRKTCCHFIKVVAPAIQEIIEGVEVERSNTGKLFWRFKLFSLFLKKVVQTEDGNLSAHSARGGDHWQHPQSTVSQICQQLPPIQAGEFFETVKNLDWFDLLSQGMCILNPDISNWLVSCLLDHATKTPVDKKDAHLISAALDCIISQWISNTATSCPIEPVAKQPDMGSISSWLKQIFHFFSNSIGNEFSNITPNLGFLLNIFKQLMLCGILSNLTDESKEKVNKLMKSALEKREITDGKNGSFTMFCTLFKKQTSKSVEIDLQSLPINFPFQEFLESLKCLCSVIQESLSSVGVLDDHDREDKIIIVSDCVFTFSLEPLVSCFSELIQSREYEMLLEHAAERDLRQTLDVIVQTTRQLLCAVREMQQKRLSDEKEQYSKYPLEDILKHHLPGCEEMLANILMDYNLEWWSKDSVCQDLLNNIELLCEVNQIKQMRSLIQQCRIQHPENTAALNNIKKVLLAAFSRLPTVLQEEMIVENYLTEPDPACLAVVGTFHKDVNVIFNKFTSDSDDKLLLDVLGLALQDPVHVMVKAVQTAVRNSGQIPVVCKILQALPDLCRCRHPVFHPEQSLLIHILHSHLLSEQLGVNEKKNTVRLVCLAVQKFERQICDGTLQEAPVLEPSEFISNTVVPFIGVENMYALNQTMSVAFSLRLLTSVMDQVGCDKSSNLVDIFDPCSIILCICALLHECVLLSDNPDRFGTKVTVKKLCLTCWLSWEEMLKNRPSVLTDSEVDWLLTQVKPFDWTILLKLQMALHLVQGHNMDDMFLDDVARHLTSDGSYVSLFRFVSISDDHLRVIALAGPVIAEKITLSLLQVLPNVTVDEAKRVCVYCKSLLSTDNTQFPFRLFFQDTMNLCDFQGMKGVLYLSQVLLEMFVLAVQTPDMFPPVVLRHMITCYVTVMRNLTQEHVMNKDHQIVTFTLIQMFCHVSVITVLMTSDLSEPLFVLILDLLSKYTAHVKRLASITSQKAAADDKQSLWGPLCQAVQMIEHKDMRRTLVKKLGEHYPQGVN